MVDNRIKKSNKVNTKRIRKILETSKKRDWKEKVFNIRRVSKVTKGGKILHFRAVVVIGNEKGTVGVGVGNGAQVNDAIKKAKNNAKKNCIKIPLTKDRSIYYSIQGVAGSAKIFIKPAGPGTGVIAGSSIRVVLELSGLQNVLAKQLGSKNALNNARATLAALKCLKTPHTISNQRNIPLQTIYQAH